ncbi:LysM peptidoglycan-binding domain-containing protein [Ramlibacter sp. MMS24-I3-19]|uniref:LysM peptidoglycan-binding domain-containing protein n=1 Tax=Ramlibacter sp. MMS24-I3-19 TaxID=3416606 RepID=UPI003D04325B
MAAVLATLPVEAQTPNLTITPGQRATAQQVAQAGVPLSALAPNAPDTYTVKKGDTLWAISTMYLTSPWRWPELWGMNMDEVRNPHLIYPGQILVLEKVDGLARLRVQGEPAPEVVRVSPRIRYQALADGSIPTLAPGAIEPFLAEPIIVGEGALQRAPRIVAATDERVLLTRGDRLYARSSDGQAMSDAGGRANDYRVFRSATPLRDPYTHAILGYEAQFLGRANLVRGEGSETVTSDGGSRTTPVPATLDVVSARSEMRVGDRLLPEPERQITSYAPRAPSQQVDAAIVSVYGDAVGLVGHNQVVVINKGTADGIESGYVMAVQRAGARIVDRSQPGESTEIKLPNERNGLLMVFRPFERLSYALVLQSSQEVQIGDRVVNPR